ncbi:MAG: hypothetical protein EWV50_12280 [Microcystis aeruginosa Ma_MB_F_20061100_S20]|uniref:Uncharacterized protein n=1 Tax=Microcystis aeruginosa Ma_MB_F_20061100_S20D TaxID=2486253 RepID=A0A552F088_MICAE|nr:MAG: hypothetical protein EWV50_12280 [Microcystis aeruginosa Ma_MB_F_20061100_S20]TRU40122.1 MAG: hypothetical protein EWV78_01765 [Microcystis aeruginosa Ma_MB_F_20061100_S20D]
MLEIVTVCVLTVIIFSVKSELVLGCWGVRAVGWAERINMLRKTSQFSGKAKPNTQHLNLSESFCWVSLGLLLGFVPQPNLR